MTRYSTKFKEAAVKKMMPPNATTVQQIKRATGVSDFALHKWRNEYRNKNNVVRVSLVYSNPAG